MTISGLKSVRDFVLVRDVLLIGKGRLFPQQLGEKGEVRDRTVVFKLTGIKALSLSLSLYIYIYNYVLTKKS